MTQYLVQPREWIFLKGYGFLFLSKNNVSEKNVIEKISKHLSGKYCQKLLDHAKQPAADVLTTASQNQFKKQQKQLAIWLAIELLKNYKSFVKFTTE